MSRPEKAPICKKKKKKNFKLKNKISTMQHDRLELHFKQNSVMGRELSLSRLLKETVECVLFLWVCF